MKYYSDIAVTAFVEVKSEDRVKLMTQKQPRLIYFREMFANSPFGKFIAEELGVSYYVEDVSGLSVGSFGTSTNTKMLGRVVFNCSDHERVLMRLKGDFEIHAME